MLLTQLDLLSVDSELDAVIDEAVSLPRTTDDGFLATNSILAMGAAWLRAARFDLPETLPALEVDGRAWTNPERVLVLYGPDQTTAAIDLEARISETGLADVQLSDVRNLAHGRHVGLFDRADSTSVVVLGDPSTQSLIARTVAALDSRVEVVDLSTKIAGPVGALDVLAGSMRLVGEIGRSRGKDPGNPGVSQAGRKLYHLSWARIARSSDGSRPIRTKALAAGMSDDSPDDFAAWQGAFETWSEGIAGRSVEAVVMDYDGTCVPTLRRTEPPISAVQTAVARLLDEGVRVAISSGRGPSVIDELRVWLPQKYWSSVLVGIYNGGVVNSLAQTVERGEPAEGALAEAAALLERALVGDGWDITARRRQVTVERNLAMMADGMIAVASVLQPVFGDSLKILKSGHSVDVIPQSVSKLAVVEGLGVDPARVLLVGDQGEMGGNDFELLSSSSFSLSVDQVSASPDRCWNLSVSGTSGSRLLAEYLDSIRGKRFDWNFKAKGRQR